MKLHLRDELVLTGTGTLMMDSARSAEATASLLRPNSPYTYICRARE